LILTTFVEDELVEQALLQGASGYVLKGISLQELHRAITIIMDGGSILDPEVAQRMIRIMQKTEGCIENDQGCFAPHEERLSRREWTIIQLIAEGLSNREIAKKLIFTEGTIRNSLTVILEKLQLRDRTQLAIWYLQNGNRMRNT
jgi:DNA-binding NarL/FixJ family response regulator